MNAILEEILARFLVATLAQDEEWLLKFYRLFSEFVREGVENSFVLRINSLLTEKINTTGAFLDLKVNESLDNATEEYTSEVVPVIITEPVFSEKPSDGSPAQELLGGEIRSTYSF